jgi:hypothetical protein
MFKSEHYYYDVRVSKSEHNFYCQPGFLWNEREKGREPWLGLHLRNQGKKRLVPKERAKARVGKAGPEESSYSIFFAWRHYYALFLFLSQSA